MLLVCWYPSGGGTQHLGTSGDLSQEMIIQGETRKHPQLVGPVPNLERLFLQESITVYKSGLRCWGLVSLPFFSFSVALYLQTPGSEEYTSTPSFS